MRQGDVSFLVGISAAGQIDAVRLLKSDPLFDQAAYDAVRTWTFSPATSAGRPVPIIISVECFFKASKRDKSGVAGQSFDELQFAASTEIHPFLAVATSGPAHNITPPKALSMPSPNYPMDARQRGIGGTIFLHLTVGVDGMPHDITIKRGLTPQLNQAALQAASQYRFRPAKKDGQPVPVEIDVEIKFRPD